MYQNMILIEAENGSKNNKTVSKKFIYYLYLYWANTKSRTIFISIFSSSRVSAIIFYFQKLTNLSRY